MRIKRVLGIVGAVVGVVALGVGGFIGMTVSAYNSSMQKQYDVGLPEVDVSTDPAVLARGEHLARSLGGCIDCHGPKLEGKLVADMGPVGIVYGPNITRGKGGVGANYSDAQMFRLLRHGIRADGKSVIFMPSQEIGWWSDADLSAVVSWWRQQPNVDGEVPQSEIGLLGKVLDRQGMQAIDIARRIDHEAEFVAPPDPAPTAAYGAYVAKLCQGCHGDGFSGGPFPGAPPDLPVPTNITRHETGIAHYSEDDFIKLLNTGVKPDGSKLDPFMPIATTSAMDETEKKALWAFLQSVSPKPFGGR